MDEALCPFVPLWDLSRLIGLGLDSIFYDPDSHILFASFKYIGYDWAGDMEKMAENPKVQEWWRMTDSYQESLVEGAKSSLAGSPPWWKGLQEVFYTA
jgi:L-rhamnose mutarotase